MSCRLTQAHGQAARDEGALLQSLIVVRAHHLQGKPLRDCSLLKGRKKQSRQPSGSELAIAAD